MIIMRDCKLVLRARKTFGGWRRFTSSFPLPFCRSASPTVYRKEIPFSARLLLCRGCSGCSAPCEGARLVWNKVETKFRPYRASYSSAVVVRMCVCVEVNTCPSHRSPALRHPTPHPAHSHHRTHSFTSRGLLIDYTPATTHAHPPRTHTPAHTHTRSQPPARTGPVVESRRYCYWRQVQRRDTREDQQSAECTIKADFCGAFLSSAVQPAERAQRAQHSLTAPGLPSEESISRRRGAEQCRK